MTIYECDGYKKLLGAVEKDEEKSSGFHDYRGKLDWAVERAHHYAEKTGLDACNILNAWESARNYWYMNYYQDANQPLLGEGNVVHVYEATDALVASFDNKGFRCPRCDGVSESAYGCTSGLEMSKGEVCNWNVGGLFGDLGKGVFVFVKDQMRGQRIFFPLAWEKAKEAAA